MPQIVKKNVYYPTGLLPPSVPCPRACLHITWARGQFCLTQTQHHTKETLKKGSCLASSQNHFFVLPTTYKSDQGLPLLKSLQCLFARPCSSPSPWLPGPWLTGSWPLHVSLIALCLPTAPRAAPAQPLSLPGMGLLRSLTFTPLLLVPQPGLPLP